MKNIIYIISLLILLFLLFYSYTEYFDYCKIDECKENYKFDETNNKCVCDFIGVKTYKPESCVPSECINGYTLDNNTNKCIKCTKPNVSSYLSNCNIENCNSGFLKDNTGKNCVSSCPNNQYFDPLFSNTCQNCLNYVVGIQYGDNDVLNNKYCKINNCPDTFELKDNTCNKCNVIGVNKYKSNTCDAIDCNFGYKLNGDKCDFCNIENVASYSDNNCGISECKSGFDKNDNSCISGNKNIFRFTNCNVIGNIGPSISECNNYYLGSNVVVDMDDTRKGIQIWKVPEDGNYLITVAGAGIDNIYKIARGAIISSVFKLTKDEKIHILVGQSGSCKPVVNQYLENYCYSGSGGSFVVRSDNTPLIIAGGGGGIYNQLYYNKNVIDFSNSENSDASFSKSGKDNNNLRDNIIIKGGVEGKGGDIYNLKTLQFYNTSGAGFETNGKTVCFDFTTKLFVSTDENNNNCNEFSTAQSFKNGGNGGSNLYPKNSQSEANNKYNSNGGFGGGSASFDYNPGAGGGYSGGASYIMQLVKDSKIQSGFGGGSYCLNDEYNKVGHNNKNGYVIIEKIS